MVELDKEQPSVEVVKYEMNKRDEFVQELSAAVKKHPVQSLDEETRSEVTAAVDRFTEMNRVIQRNLKKLKAKQQKVLENAMTHRKAIKGYNISKTPDISYF